MDGNTRGIPLATAFLCGPGGEHGTLPDQPLRSRYTLELRMFHLVEKHGRFFWDDHLEQVADWTDTLIVDVGHRSVSDEPEAGLQAGVAWNSGVPGSIDDTDPITAEPLQLVEDGEDLYTEIPLPEVVHPILGNEVRLRLSVRRAT